MAKNGEKHDMQEQKTRPEPNKSHLFIEKY